MVHIRSYCWLGYGIAFIALLFLCQPTGRPTPRAIYSYAFALFEDGLKVGRIDAEKFTELFLFAGDYTYFYGTDSPARVLWGNLVWHAPGVKRLPESVLAGKPQERKYWQMKSAQISRHIKKSQHLPWYSDVYVWIMQNKEFLKLLEY